MKVLVCSLVLILCLCCVCLPFPVSAQTTLADTLNTRANQVAWPSGTGGSATTVQYMNIFGKADTSAYDTQAQFLLSASNWAELIKLKRAAEVSGYDSATLNNAVKQALQNIPMVGALPICSPFGANFFVGFRYVLYGYKYAEEMGVSRWNKQAGYQQLASLVDKYGGGFLYCYINTAEYTSQPNTRYYDEQAETLGCFQILYDLGVNEAKAYEDRLWQHLLNDGWWTGQWFWYRPAWQCWECEMGPFALVISKYLGSPPSQVISDINYKLLRSGWQTPGWMGRYVINHAESPTGVFVTNEMRPWETLNAWRALHSLYPSMTGEMQTNMVSMLSQNGWQLALNSGCFDADWSRQTAGLMTAFLMGIIPSSTTLNARFDMDQYIGTDIEFPVNQWHFDYSNRRITIPVKGSGQLKFLFGTSITTGTFPSGGVYNVTFSSDWNAVTDVRLASGSTPPPPNKGTARLFASYQGSYIATLVIITGPEIKSGTTTTDSSDPLSFELTAGAYTVSGTYAGTLQTASVTVVAGQTTDATLNFGGSPPPPPPNLWGQIVEFISQNSKLLFLGAVAVFGVGLWYGSKRLSKGTQTPSFRRRKFRKHKRLFFL